MQQQSFKSILELLQTAAKGGPSKVDTKEMVKAGVRGAASGAVYQGLWNYAAGSGAGRSLYNSKGDLSPGKAAGKGTNLHSSGKQHGDSIHYSQIQEQVKTMDKSGNYSDIYVNKGIRNVLPNAVRNFRPDVMGIRNNGLIDIFEVQSPSQSINFMTYKTDMLRNMLGNQAGEVSPILRIVK